MGNSVPLAHAWSLGTYGSNVIWALKANLETQSGDELTALNVNLQVERATLFLYFYFTECLPVTSHVQSMCLPLEMGSWARPQGPSSLASHIIGGIETLNCWTKSALLPCSRVAKKNPKESVDNAAKIKYFWVGGSKGKGGSGECAQPEWAEVFVQTDKQTSKIQQHLWWLHLDTRHPRWRHVT